MPNAGRQDNDFPCRFCRISTLEMPKQLPMSRFSKGKWTYFGLRFRCYRYNISSIVNVTSNLPNAFEATGAVRYLRIPVDDNDSHNLADYFPGKK